MKRRRRGGARRKAFPTPVPSYSCAASRCKNYDGARRRPASANTALTACVAPATRTKRKTTSAPARTRRSRPASHRTPAVKPRSCGTRCAGRAAAAGHAHSSGAAGRRGPGWTGRRVCAAWSERRSYISGGAALLLKLRATPEQQPVRNGTCPGQGPHRGPPRPAWGHSSFAASAMERITAARLGRLADQPHAHSARAPSSAMILLHSSTQASQM